MKELIKSVFAGAMIGIACSINLVVGGGYIGAVLFSIGLCIICLQKYNLFTGKIGYIESIKQLPTYLLYILGNLIGVTLITLITNVDSTALSTAKLDLPLLLVFGKSIGCGFLMYIAVDTFKSKYTLTGVIGCVIAFVLAGFEHSIADMFYFINSNLINVDSLIFILVVILGNALGSLLHKLLK